jgi:prolyl oligopeptidase
VTVREINLPSASFVKDGFVLPHGKQRVAWEDPNTLLVAREWAPGEITKSGYPYIVKRIKRGQPLSAATEVFRGTANDGGYGVSPFTLDDGDGNHAVFVSRPLSTFEAEQFILTRNGFEKLALPLKSSVSGLVAGRIIITLDTAWTPAGGTAFKAGSVVSVPLAAMLASPAKFAPTLVVAPGPRESIGGMATTKNALILTQLDNVRGRAYTYTPARANGWTRAQLKFPDNLTIGIVDADAHSNTAFLGVTGFLTPSSVWLVDA